jgi:hypothetical protein
MDQRWFRATNVSSAVRLYCFWFLVIFLTSMLTIGFVSIPKVQPKLSGVAPLPYRVQHYLQDPHAYSVIFLGDSRTYCGIHPELIEQYVNTMHGLNLSHFAHWLPTQYSMVRDIVDSIPNDTLVVWSIGHQSFFLEGGPSFDVVQPTYPVSFADAFKMIEWNGGVPLRGLARNFIDFHGSLYAIGSLPRARQRLERAIRKGISVARAAEIEGALADAPTARNVVSMADAEQLKEAALKEPDIVAAEVTEDQGHATSIVRYFRRGGFHRTELDQEFFRAKQRTMGGSSDYSGQEPQHVQLKLFDAILDLFAERRTRLVVNEVEEAPFIYTAPENRERWRRFMRDRIQPRVENRGFAYERTDLDRLHDDDYFDYNHLNSQGIEKYTPMIAEIVRRHLPMR